jgi:hypothetical protein
MGKIGYVHEFHIPIHGWLAFKFYLEVNPGKILARKWYWGPSILALKRWIP